MRDALDRAQTPRVAPPPTVELPPIIRHTLANGLGVLVVEKHDLPVVDVVLVTRAGGYADPPALAGRAALAADLLDEGTASRSALEIAETADQLGASLYSRATWDEIAVGLHVLAPRLEPALALLIDVALRPAFTADEIERKRKERLAAIVQEQDEPRILASQGFARAVYGGEHPFGAPLGGTARSVQALDRDAFAGFYAGRQRPGNGFLVVVGEVRTDAVLTALEDALAGWQDEPVPPDASLPAPVRVPRIHLLDRPGAPQSEIRVGHEGAARGTPDYFPMLVLNTILGGAFTSRLNSRLREEKGFTYGAGSAFAFRRHGGPFVASSAVFTGATAEAIGIVLHEMRRIRDERVTASELERARSYLALGLPRRFETTGDVARLVIEQELYGLGADFYTTFVERVRAVSAQQVQEAAERRLDPDHATVVVAGDRTAIEPDLRALDAGDVVVMTSPSD